MSKYLNKKYADMLEEIIEDNDTLTNGQINALNYSAIKLRSEKSDQADKKYRIEFLGERHVLTRRSSGKPYPFNYEILWEYSEEIQKLRTENPNVDVFTEQEIKAIDERYWLFAVEVTV